MFKIFSSTLLFAALTFAQTASQPPATAVSITGYLRDSGCVHRYPEVSKPLPNGCVQMCARGGSPLVILTKDEHVYHPISPDIPDTDIRGKLLPYVGKLVKITGHTYTRGDSTAITLEHIQEVKE